MNENDIIDGMIKIVISYPDEDHYYFHVINKPTTVNDNECL
jgi:hypothetical protein